MGWVERQVAELAQGADVLRFRNAYGAIPDATEYVEVTDLDVTAPLARGKLGLVAGAVPDEPARTVLLLSDLLLTLTGAGIGDEVTIALEGLEAPFTVVGTVRGRPLPQQECCDHLRERHGYRLRQRLEQPRVRGSGRQLADCDGRPRWTARCALAALGDGSIRVSTAARVSGGPRS